MPHSAFFWRGGDFVCPPFADLRDSPLITCHGAPRTFAFLSAGDKPVNVRQGICVSSLRQQPKLRGVLIFDSSRGNGSRQAPPPTWRAKWFIFKTIAISAFVCATLAHNLEITHLFSVRGGGGGYAHYRTLPVASRSVVLPSGGFGRPTHPPILG